MIHSRIEELHGNDAITQLHGHPVEIQLDLAKDMSDHVNPLHALHGLVRARDVLHLHNAVHPIAPHLLFELPLHMKIDELVRRLQPQSTSI